MKKKVLIGSAISVAVILLVLGAIIVYRNIHYNDIWYDSTIVNGIDISGLTVDEAKNKILNDKRDYSLNISARNNGALMIVGSDIGYQLNIGEEFDKLFEAQHSGIYIFPTKSSYDLKYNASYDKEKLKDILFNCELIKGSDTYPIEKPVPAKPEFSEEKQYFVCKQEFLGNKLKKKAFLAAVESSLMEARSEINLDDAEHFPDVYKKPSRFSTDPKITKQVNACNNTALKFVVWDLGNGLKEKLTPKTIATWINYKDGLASIDEAKLTKWVENFCLKYKTVDKNRTFVSHTGKKVKVPAGDYGWQLNYDKTLEQAKSSVLKELDSEIIETYIADPSQENKRSLTFKKKAVYLATAAKQSFGQNPEDWDPDNYTEVSLADQMVYVHRGGKVAFKCKCITGLPVAGRQTTKGVFFIKEHRDAYTLKGADYETPVVNWVRITWSGTGFHPATWQPWSRWSKTLYKTRGSHGCVNLHPDDAKKIYELTKYKEAVFIH
ncbi:L,D-transpeptidase family protein [Eubacterium xylanophilum]|uniref:L,D-transpeptidase family protein n=1 Tax=Eubacterium xylanophilum TaxID=39497 RepID=UPI00047CFC87|nr:L,D-transpeptidase family protein [Eubacterium xylanophilum]